MLIIFFKRKDKNMLELEKYLLNFEEVKKLKAIDNLPSKWQSHQTVYDHILAVLDQVRLICPNNKIMIICAVLHDLGKLVTKTIKNGYIIFPKHADLSVVLAKPIIDTLIEEKKILTAREEFIVYYIIENHMKPMKDGLPWTQKSIEKFLLLYDSSLDERFELLLLFTDLDIRGSNPNRIPKGVWTKEIQNIKDAINIYKKGKRYE
jgi:hypothetical protein